MYPSDIVLKRPLAPWETDVRDHPLVRPAVKETASSIFRGIASGKYAHLTRLPSERKLCEEFGQSRGTVRQAIGFLANYGVVARVPGGGSFVSIRVEHDIRDDVSIDRECLAETISPIEMFVVQCLIEPEIAKLATLMMSSLEISKLGEILEDLIDARTTVERILELELQFMMKLCEGTRNAALIGMYRVLIDTRDLPLWRRYRNNLMTPERVCEVKRTLTSLYAALECRKSAIVVACMKHYVYLSKQEMVTLEAVVRKINNANN